MKRAGATQAQSRHKTVTESHEFSQWEPSPQQAAAIEALVVGKADGEAAELADVTRETVNRWRNHDVRFRTALERRRRETWASYHDRIRALVGKALDALEQALADPDLGLTAVGHLAKLVRLQVGAPDGETDPHVILRAEARAWAETYMVEHHERRESALDELLAGMGDEAEAWNSARLRELTEQRLGELRAGQGSDR